MRCLVTGGAGFIGSNLVKALVARGDAVTVLDDLSTGYKRNLDGLAAELVEGDVRDAACVSRAMRGVEVVFHLAASVGNKKSIDFPILDAEINALGTLRVLESCREHHVKKVVVSSSAGIFGELKKLPIREDHPLEPDTPYGASKLYEEKVSLSYSKLYPIEAVCLRYFNVYGPNQRYDAYGNVIPIFVFNMLRAQPLNIFGDGEQTRDFVNVSDVVQANLKAAASRGTSGAFNVASGTQITINKLTAMLGSVSGMTPDIKHGAPRPGDVRDSVADIGAARRTLGYEPRVSIEDGLREYVAWARQALTES